MDPALHPIEWLDARAATGDVHIVATENSCFVTEFRQFPSGAWEIHGVIAVGIAREIAGVLVPQAEKFGAEMGCIFSSIASRRGWVKLLPNYHEYQVELRKEL